MSPRPPKEMSKSNGFGLEVGEGFGKAWASEAMQTGWGWRWEGKGSNYLSLQGQKNKVIFNVLELPGMSP